MQIESTQAIVLRKMNYGEADKIITSLTSSGKKISIIAKGVRKPKSKLAAGTELFCVSDICFAPGKGSLATLTSARIVNQHTSFLGDLEKVTLAYDVIRIVNKHTEDIDGSHYFEILQQLFAALDDTNNDVAIVRLWAWTQVLYASGHQLQLQHQTNGSRYTEEAVYGFDAESGGFVESTQGRFGASHIKLMRLAQTQSLRSLRRIQNAEQYAHDLAPIIKQFVDSTY